MITNTKVIDSKFSGLENYFPIGSELQVEAPIVLIVGPNGSGKTGFMRMLATSIQNEKFFRENGISRAWKYFYPHTPIEERVKECKEKAKLVEDDWYYVPGAKDTLTQLKSHPLFTFTDSDLRMFENENNKKYSHIASISALAFYSAFYAISKKALDLILNAEELLRDKNETNVWRYLKPTTMDGDLYTQEFSLPAGEDAKDISKKEDRRYSEFDPTFNGNSMVKVSDCSKKIHDQVDALFGTQTEYNPDAVRRLKDSPGQKLMDRLNSFFQQVSDFFEKKQNPEFAPSTYSIEERMTPWRVERWPKEKVADNSQLVVVMDEPTDFLDYKNKQVFRDRIVELVDKYAPKIQFFIPTNDIVLIEKIPNCKIINLYKMPAESVSSFSLI